MILITGGYETTTTRDLATVEVKYLLSTNVVHTFASFFSTLVGKLTSLLKYHLSTIQLTKLSEDGVVKE